MFPNLVYNNLSTTTNTDNTKTTSKSDERAMSKASTSSSLTSSNFLNHFIPTTTSMNNMSSKQNKLTKPANLKQFSGCNEPSFLASLNARAVLLNNLIQNSTSATISSTHAPTNPLNLLPNLNLTQEQNLFNLNPFALAANEYFNNYLLSLNQNIQFDKVSFLFFFNFN